MPWTVVDRYAERNGLDDEEFDELLYLVEQMDLEYLAVRAEQRERDRPPGGKGGKGGGQRSP